MYYVYKLTDLTYCILSCLSCVMLLSTGMECIVLLSVRVFFKLLIYHFQYGIIAINIKFIHEHFFVRFKVFLVVTILMILLGGGGG
jgi:hypothetical protein